MNWGLIGAFAASFAYGVATILQSLGARAGGVTDDLDTRLVKRLMRSAPYLGGLALDAVGFGLSFAALHTLPLFTVEAIVASSLAVTAVLAVAVLHVHASLMEWLAVGSVTVGLIFLGLSASPEASVHLTTFDRALLVISVAVLGVVAFTAARRRRVPRRGDAWVLGMLTGLMFGGAGIGARMLRTPSAWWRVVLDPAFYAMALAGLLGLLLYAMALQRATVTVVQSAVVVTETLMPAAVGILALGDRPAPGRTTIAALGFAMTVLGALALARYAEVPQRDGEPLPSAALGTLPAP
ncbi:MAG TPA: hypothetical protein VMH41_04530 [Mycobacteriales bacterium]|nr:hypothetical protein [Mycobacteriales bacterium]